MPWTPPNDPVTATVITVAYAVANMLTQIRWLRLMTGNADPPGSAYILTSDSVSAVTWKQLGAAIVGGQGLGYSPVNRAGDTMTGALVVALGTDPATGIVYLGSSGTVYLDNTGSLLRLVGKPVQVVQLLNASGGILAADDITTYRASAPTTGYIQLGAPGFGHPLGWDGAQFVAGGSRIWRQADFVVGNAAGNVPLNNNTVNTGLVAASATNATNATNATSAATATNATQLGGRAPGGLSNQVPYNGGAGFLNQGLSAEFLNGQPGSYYEALAGGGGGTGTVIPTGLICLWNTATPPTGWVIETAFRERFPLSASAPAGTWPLGTNAGAANHTHATNITHGHADTIGVGGTVGAATGGTPEVNVVTPGTKTAADTHAHGFTGSKSGGVTALGSSPITSDPTAHMPVFYAIHYIRKS